MSDITVIYYTAGSQTGVEHLQSKDGKIRLCQLEDILEKVENYFSYAVIEPINPGDVEFLQTNATVKCHDSIACITQYLKGVPA